LKTTEKSGLRVLKPLQKQQPDVLVISVNTSDPDIMNHTPFVTVKDLELRAAKKATREEKVSRLLSWLPSQIANHNVPAKATYTQEFKSGRR